MNKNSLEHELACYYRQIKKQLVCKSAKKKKLIAELKGSIVEYLEDHSDSTIKNIAEHFGSPADIADSYISSMEGDELGEIYIKAGGFYDRGYRGIYYYRNVFGLVPCRVF